MNRLPVRAAARPSPPPACSPSSPPPAAPATTSAPAGATALSFKLTDAGCDPHDAKAPAGPINFEIENGGSGSVTEIEVLDGETILGEKENLTEGLQRQLLADPRGRRVHPALQQRRRRKTAP